ncbi:hypothetical protein TYM08_P2226 [Marinicellulosiphila megalodicopiae]
MLIFTSLSYAETLGEIDIDVWGYEDTENKTYRENTCLIGFAPKKQEYRYIKSINNSQEIPDAKYRFTLVKEEYASKDEFNKRLEFIKNPPHSNSLVSKMCNIREAFVEGDVVYFVHTDVGVFTTEMKHIVVLFHQSLQP